MTQDDELDTLLASFLTLLPVEDAAASSLGKPFDLEVLGATSARAAALDEAQIDLGEGPAWDAYRIGGTVTAHLNGTDRSRWPFFSSSPAAAGAGTMIVLPLAFGPLRIGAVSLSGVAAPLEEQQVTMAENLAVLVGRAVTAQALALAQDGAAQRDPAFSRREVHQATGMLISQLGTTPADALLTLRAHAFSSSMTVREVAAEIVGRRLDLSADPDDRK